MARSLTIVLVLAASLASCGCGFMEHLLGAPEAAPPLGESILASAGLLFDRGLIGDYTQPAGQCIPSETGEACNDTAGDRSQSQPVLLEQLAGIWVEAEYGSTAVHIGADGSIRQVDLAEMIAGQPLATGIPRTLYNVGQVTVTPDGEVTAEASLSVAGFSATGEGTGYLSTSLNALFGMTVQGKMTILGKTTELYIPNTVWFRYDPQTGTFPFMDDLYWLDAAGSLSQ